MNINQIIEAEIKINPGKFETEKKEIEYRKKSFVFVESYENFDLYRHKTARLS